MCLTASLTVSWGSITRSSTPPVQEYCQLEVFNASCPSRHVIVMESAWYGRMRLGRRISAEESDVYIGCATDVLALMDARCSGRQSCAVHIPDPDLDEQQQACPMDLLVYLEASYTCVNGSQHTCPTTH